MVKMRGMNVMMMMMQPPCGDQSSLVKDVCCSNPCLSPPQLQTHKYVTSFQHVQQSEINTWVL